jgi:hypothetical protein
MTDAPAPLGQGQNLARITADIASASRKLPAPDLALALIAGGLDLLGAARCQEHLLADLQRIRDQVDAQIQAVFKAMH